MLRKHQDPDIYHDFSSQFVDKHMRTIFSALQGVTFMFMVEQLALNFALIVSS